MLLSLCKANSDHAEGLDYLFAQAKEIACKLPQGLPFIEIGTRAGGSALLFLQAIKESGIPRPLITVDPYGKGYDREEGFLPPMGEERYRSAMQVLSGFCLEHHLNHYHYHMTSEDWMSIWDRSGCWVDGERLNDHPFALVYLDGEHTQENVAREVNWINRRMALGGLLVIDDTENIRDPEYPSLRELWSVGESIGNRLYVKKEEPSFANVCKNNGQPKFAVVTIACGDAYQKIAKLTHPTIKAYADKIGAEFIVIDKSDRSSPHWMKFQLHDLLNQYDRIV